jgi:hypothetical protein
MPETIDLKALESRAYRSFFADGIWDLYLGLLLLSMGCPIALRSLGVPLPWAAAAGIAVCAVAMAVFFCGKKLLTIPRLGHANFAPSRVARRRRTTAVLAFSALLGVAVLCLTMTGSMPGAVLAGVATAALVFSGNCLLVFSLAAYFLDFSRLYLYGLLYAASFPLATVTHVRTSIPHWPLGVYAVMSTPMLVIGVTLLVRFLRKHPIPTEAATDGSG